MTHQCYTFETSRGPVQMTFDKGMTPDELAQAQEMAEYLVTHAPKLTEEQAARQDAARQRNHERLERIKRGHS